MNHCDKIAVQIESIFGFAPHYIQLSEPLEAHTDFCSMLFIFIFFYKTRRNICQFVILFSWKLTVPGFRGVICLNYCAFI